MLLVALLGTAGASRLTINTNQLDLISQDLRQVKDVKRVVDMIGGTGHLILALRGRDQARLKAVSDDVAAALLADEEHVREVTYKVSTEFLLLRGALFMETADLEELRRRVTAKLRDVLKRANPFFFEIRKTEPVELKIDDLLEKYSRIGKKSITDDYYVSDDREMLLLLLKPMWDSNSLGRTGELVGQIRERLAAYGHDNPHGARLVEDYTEEPDPDPQVVEFGFTGSYQTNYDDSFAIRASLVPVAGVALAGIVLVLLLFFGRHAPSALLVLAGLLLGIGETFGFAWLAIGQLNMVTSILAGILMGLGIDFGIHLVHRLREELGRGLELEAALTHTIESAGPASLVAAAGTGVAFLSLLFSDFRGFTHFGLLAGVGVFLIGASIYVWVPAVLLVLERWRPGLATRLVGRHDLRGAEGREARVPRPLLVLAVSVALAGGLSTLAPRVPFEYNTRALLVEGQASVRLQDEINHRYRISSDPVAVYTPTLEDARKVFDLLHPVDEERFSTVDQVVSLFTFVPDRERQERNAAILADWRAEVSEIDPRSLPPEYGDRWEEALTYLSARPFTEADLPPRLRGMFRHLPTTRPDNHGFLTFIYAVVDLWDGKQMLQFASEVEDLDVGGGRVYHAAGGPILFAKLARIVLHDGRFCVVLTALLILLILVVDLRSLSGVLVALLPLVLGVGAMLGFMAAVGASLNFMNVVVFPVVLGYGVSHGVYLIHRFYEGSSPREALRSVGRAVACSTLTTLAGWAALLVAAHRGLKSMGMLACVGMLATLLVSFTVMPAILQVLHDRRTRRRDA